jgi:hypothetical protein
MIISSRCGVAFEATRHLRPLQMSRKPTVLMLADELRLLSGCARLHARGRVDAAGYVEVDLRLVE